MKNILQVGEESAGKREKEAAGRRVEGGGGRGRGGGRGGQHLQERKEEKYPLFKCNLCTCALALRGMGEEEEEAHEYSGMCVYNST